jgi:hypothetical protein
MRRLVAGRCGTDAVRLALAELGDSCVPAEELRFAWLGLMISHFRLLHVLQAGGGEAEAAAACEENLGWVEELRGAACLRRPRAAHAQGATGALSPPG